MEKPKRDPVIPEMRQRLIANRDGRLTTSQWFDIIVEPLIILVVLLGLSFIIFSDDMLALFEDASWLILPLIALIIFLPAILRAYRYARAPIQFTRLYAGVQPWWGFWKPMVFYTKDDKLVRFPRRLAPRMLVRINGEYLIYYLEEPGGKVLLSLAPVDHEDAEFWMPTKRFGTRHERRTGRG